MQKSFTANFQDKSLIEMNSARWLSATASTHARNAWWVKQLVLHEIISYEIQNETKKT